MPYIRLEGCEQQNPNSEQGKEAMQRGIEGLKTVLLHQPQSWPSLWMLGKAEQARGNHEESYNYFLQAHKTVLTEQNVLRELALECLHTKRFDQAAYYCQAAMEFDLNDYTLWTNMGLARLFQGKLDEAETWATKALEKLPDDEPAKSLLKIVGEVRAGKRPLPTDFETLEQEDEGAGGSHQ